MSALRNVEDTIGGFVERVFGRLFRGHVEPVELARKLAREMEDHKTVSVSRVYVPNEFVVYLSSADRGRFSTFEGALTTELAVYLAERARHEGFTLLSPPNVTLETDTDLRVGEYGIACRVVDPPVEGPVEVDAATPDPASAPIPAAPPAVVEAAGPANGGEDAAGEPGQPDLALDAHTGAPDGTLADERQVVADGGDPGDEADSPAGDRLEDDATGSEREAEPVASATPGTDGDSGPERDREPDAVAPAGAEAPAPPEPTPLPPPGVYEPLAGVSGTQILSAADAQAEGLVQEEMSLVVQGRRHRLTRRTTTIGRSRDCDIVVEDANASRQHAEVRHIGLDYFIVDLGSTNGTQVNGQRIRRHALAHGDRIVIGTSELVVEHLA